MTRHKRDTCTFGLNCTPHTDSSAAASHPRFSRVFLFQTVASLTTAISRRCNSSTHGDHPAAIEQHPPSNVGTIFTVKTSNPTKTPWGRHSCLSKKFDRQECLPHARKKTVWTGHRLHTYNCVQPLASCGK